MSRSILNRGVFLDGQAHPIGSSSTLGSLTTWSALTTTQSGRFAFLGNAGYPFVITTSVSVNVDSTHLQIGTQANPVIFPVPCIGFTATATNIPSNTTVTNVVPDVRGYYIVTLSNACTGSVSSVTFKITDSRVAQISTDYLLGQTAIYDAMDPASPYFNYGTDAALPDGLFGLIAECEFIIPCNYIPANIPSYSGSIHGKGRQSTFIEHLADPGPGRFTVRPQFFAIGGQSVTIAGLSIVMPHGGSPGTAANKGNGIFLNSHYTFEDFSISYCNAGVYVGGNHITIRNCSENNSCLDTVYFGFAGTTPNQGNTLIEEIGGNSLRAMITVSPYTGIDTSVIDGRSFGPAGTPFVFWKELAAGGPLTASGGIMGQSVFRDCPAEAMQGFAWDANAAACIAGTISGYNGGGFSRMIFEGFCGATTGENQGATSLNTFIPGLPNYGLMVVGQLYSSKFIGETNFCFGTNADTNLINGTIAMQSAVALPPNIFASDLELNSAGGTLAGMVGINGFEAFKQFNGTSNIHGLGDGTSSWETVSCSGIWGYNVNGAASQQGKFVAGYDGTSAFDNAGSGKYAIGAVGATAPHAYSIVPIITSGLVSGLNNTNAIQTSALGVRGAPIYLDRSNYGNVTQTASGNGSAVGFCTSGTTLNTTSVPLCLLDLGTF